MLAKKQFINEDKRKVEYIDGVAYMMSLVETRHNRVGGNLYAIIHRFLRKKRCQVFYETTVVFDEKNHFIPDIMVVCDPSKIKDSFIEGAPDFVAEILSPSTRRRDLSIKRDAYEKFGVKEYWVIDPKAETVDVYTVEDGKFTMSGSYHNYTEGELQGLDEEDLAQAALPLKLSLYDELTVDLQEMFE